MKDTQTSVLLLHGLCSTADELLPVHGVLRDGGHRVVPVVLPGYSYDASRGEQHSTPFGHWLQAVADEARRQRAEGRRVVAVGISAGATLALGTAMLGARLFDGLVLMSTTLRYDGWAIPRHHFLMPLALYTPLGRFWRYRERPPYGVKNPRVRRWVERELQARSVSSAGAAVIGVPHLREHDRLRRLVRRRLGDFDCPPVLALHAREDEVAGPGIVSVLQRQLRTPSFRGVLLPDSHHMITIDNDRQQVARETADFVDAVAAMSSGNSFPLPGATDHALPHL